MRSIRKGYILAPLLSTLWAITIVWCLSVISSFSTGDAFKPNFLLTSLSGLTVGLVCSRIKGFKKNHKLGIFLLLFIALVVLSPITRLTDKSFNNLEFFLNSLFSVIFIISNNSPRSTRKAFVFSYINYLYFKNTERYRFL